MAMSEREIDKRPRAAGPELIVPRLHVCTRCSSELVYPITWERRQGCWEISLRCPECEVHRTGLYAIEAIEAFDAELCRGDDVLVGTLKALQTESLDAEAAAFGLALDNETILPEDF